LGVENRKDARRADGENGSVIAARNFDVSLRHLQFLI
jgi:hypothetical protein